MQGINLILAGGTDNLLHYEDRAMSDVGPITRLTKASQPLCIHHLVEEQAKRIPNAVAIVSPGRAPLTYGRLHLHIDDVAQTLLAMGLSRYDRVALVLPNGPEMAVAFLAVAAGWICVPLNPAYGTNEFDLYFADLNIKALITEVGMNSSALGVARRRGIRIIELLPIPEAEAGIFTLPGNEQMCTTRQMFAQPSDVALVLHTSGTTSRPKIVPLTHSNICASAHNTRLALALDESDRCLSVLPLFHTHGLIATMLASMAAGASIVCTPGFDALKFFTWIEEFRPTWYTAVPTIHQVILARAALNRDLIAHYPLRLIRSASASLPLQVLAELERMFNAPVIEMYGMTEASAQITCNLLQPHKRKIGSVGVAAGPEIAIMDEVGTILPACETGEIVVRGASVFQGYENNPTANKSAFRHGWFRTGDQGYLDNDRYLFITGRLKEVINRGGEKVSPREVEEVLMGHPAVAEVAAFPILHTQLGEDVAVAIVLRAYASATDREVRAFAATRLADFKVPRQVVFVDEIPKSATGKVQRIGLAERLGLLAPGRTPPLTPNEKVGRQAQPPLNQSRPELETTFVAPRTSVETVVTGIWAEVLGVEHIGIYDNFFELGGHSLLATQVMSRLHGAFGVELPLRSMLEAPTVAALAEHIETARWALQDRQAPCENIMDDHEEGEL